MTIKTQRLAFAKILSSHYSQEEISSFFHLITEHYFGWNKFETHQNNDTQLSREQQQYFSEALDRLQHHEPIQYILGETEFYGLPFTVNEHTLIPRPETEELVAWIISDFSNQISEFKILDIGTGSGCIAIALAKELEKAKVSGVDISEAAIEIAVENASKNKVDVAFTPMDVLVTETLPSIYDVIVSNPPYVRVLEKKMMQKNVLEFEPETALFVKDDDPLLFYRKIAQLALLHLKIGGSLYFEINEYLGLEMRSLLESLGFKNCIIKKDIYGKDRMMRAIL